MREKCINAMLAICLCSSFTQTVYAYAPAIAGCTPTTVEGSNSTVTAINDSSTFTSSIVIAGQSGTISDVDVRTFITHTAGSDIEMTLTSPAGTVVTLTTDNGGSNDDIFNGTLWDDQVDPLGAIPFGNAFLNNLVVKHDYTNSEPVTALVP